jgi:hypothetical protein
MLGQDRTAIHPELAFPITRHMLGELCKCAFLDANVNLEEFCQSVVCAEGPDFSG